MEAKGALDKVISKARVHFYKPIQIAEVLYRIRNQSELIDPSNLTTYRTTSRSWRDEISQRLVGNSSTSSARYQDDVFNENAMPPRLLAGLAKLNNETNGGVEAYIYLKMNKKLEAVHAIGRYIAASSPENFSLEKMVSMFIAGSGLKNSIDKIYEIITYALFSVIVEILEATVTLEVHNEDRDVLSDFKDFIKTVLGIDHEKTKMVSAAKLYRAGTANAADSGLDMWANFGPAFQVKHISLSPEWLESSSGKLFVDKLIIICLDSEKETIALLLQQLGLENKIQGIITLNDLLRWYQLCMDGKYQVKLGAELLKSLLEEFNNEFPTNANMQPFLDERGYSPILLPQKWLI